MIESLEHHITDHCNLNCAGCSHCSPLAYPWFETLDEFKEEWRAVYDKGLQIKRIRILGGEPLLNMHLPEMVAYARELFPKSDVNVVTNGILLKKRKEELLPVFIENDISLTLSKYPGLNLDYNEILGGFPKVGVYDKAGFWNISLHENSDFDPELAFYNCFSASVAQCSYLEHGRIYPCPIIPNLVHLIRHFPELRNTELGKIDIKSGGITIKDHTVEEIEQFLHTPKAICGHCNVIRAQQNQGWKQTEYKIEEWVEKL